eukprot:1415929-Prymnesium_polylepis.3
MPSQTMQPASSFWYPGAFAVCVRASLRERRRPTRSSCAADGSASHSSAEREERSGSSTPSAAIDARRGEARARAGRGGRARAPRAGLTGRSRVAPRAGRAPRRRSWMASRRRAWRLPAAVYLMAGPPAGGVSDGVAAAGAGGSGGV